MIAGFRDKGTEDVFNGEDSKHARRACPNTIWRVARKKLDQLNAAKGFDELKVPPSNRFEKLKGNRDGQHSIRINDQYRICFTWNGKDAEDVEIADYH